MMVEKLQSLENYQKKKLTMNKEYIKARLIELENYLERKWQGISDHFVERLLARAEYDRLNNQLKKYE